MGLTKTYGKPHSFLLLYPAIKIIAQWDGGYFRAKDLLQMAHELGADAIQTKPVQYEKLCTQLKQLEKTKF